MRASIGGDQTGQECVFCRIRDGKLRASMIIDEPLVYAMMSIEQPNPYKVLVIPKPHVPTLFDLSAELAAAVFQATVRVSKAVRAASACDGLNLVQSNGRAGQQDVFHFHLHVVPRYEGDRIVLDWDNSPTEREELDRLAAEIRGEM